MQLAPSPAARKVSKVNSVMVYKRMLCQQPNRVYTKESKAICFIGPYKRKEPGHHQDLNPCHCLKPTAYCCSVTTAQLKNAFNQSSIRIKVKIIIRSFLFNFYVSVKITIIIYNIYMKYI